MLAHQRQNRGPHGAADDEAGIVEPIVPGSPLDSVWAQPSARAIRLMRRLEPSPTGDREQRLPDRLGRGGDRRRVLVDEREATRSGRRSGALPSPDLHTRQSASPSGSFEQGPDPGQELGAVGAVEDPVITGQGDPHQPPDGDLASRARPASR